MELTIIVAIIAFLAVTLLLVGLLLFAKAKLTSSGEVTIDINGGEKVITTERASGSSIARPLLARTTNRLGESSMIFAEPNALKDASMAVLSVPRGMCLSTMSVTSSCSKRTGFREA